MTELPDTAPDAPTPRGRARILVIDDERSMANVIGRMLRVHDVVSLVDPREALAWFVRGERFDVILCDLMMPDLTGAELFARLESVAPDQAVRVIFLTGGASTAETKAFLETVERPVLIKPFSAVELLEEIDRLLRG